MAADVNLDALRDEIDKIDEVIVRLLDSRARIVYSIGRIKHELGRPIYEPSREASVIAHVRAVNESLGGPLDGDAVARLYERVMDEARRIQRLEANRANRDAGVAPQPEATATVDQGSTNRERENES
jgi:chorismate mutase